MKNQDSILLVKNYGKIHIKLGEVLQARGISRNYLARAINSRFEVVDRWCEGDLEKIDADVLAKICYVLKCKVEDIIEYRK